MENESVLTPLVKLAAELHPHIFFYLYPHPFYFSVDKDSNLVLFERRAWSWKLIPWLFSIVIVTGIIGVGSCAYVTISQLLDLREHNVPLISQLVILAALALGCIEISGCVLLFCHPELHLGFNEVFALEAKCKM